MIKNNVTRYLDAKKITYTSFALPAEKLGALETARLLGVAPDIVFKTIVCLREKPGKPVLAVIPATCEVNLKAVAASLGEKKVQLATQKTAEKITGLRVGGISPLALLHKGFLVILDESALSLENMHISGGQVGLNIRLPVEELIKMTDANHAPIGAVTQNGDGEP